MNALEVHRLTVSYGGRPVLWDVEASFPAQSLSAIVGPNGAGKSTLLRACVGLVPTDAGQALVLGQPARQALSQVAYVPQRNAVDWDFPVTVREVVEMGRYPRAGWFRRLGREHRDAVDAALDALDRPDAQRVGRVFDVSEGATISVTSEHVVVKMPR